MLIDYLICAMLWKLMFFTCVVLERPDIVAQWTEPWYISCLFNFTGGCMYDCIALMTC